jgi:hypothetical protein
MNKLAKAQEDNTKMQSVKQSNNDFGSPTPEERPA